MQSVITQMDHKLRITLSGLFRCIAIVAACVNLMRFAGPFVTFFSFFAAIVAMWLACKAKRPLLSGAAAVVGATVVVIAPFQGYINLLDVAYAGAVVGATAWLCNLGIVFKHEKYRTDIGAFAIQLIFTGIMMIIASLVICIILLIVMVCMSTGEGIDFEQSRSMIILGITAGLFCSLPYGLAATLFWIGRQSEP